MRHRRAFLPIQVIETHHPEESQRDESKTIRKGSTASGALLLWLLVFWILFLVVVKFLSTTKHTTANTRRSSSTNTDWSPIQLPSDTYHVFYCPERPPPDYPREYPIRKVLDHWNPGQVTPNGRRPFLVHQGICVFDLQKQHADSNVVQRQIQHYRAQEVPFVIRGDDDVLRAVALWNQPEYLRRKLEGKQFLATLSNQTLMTYYSLDPDYNEIPKDFRPPTRTQPMSYQEWEQRSTTTSGVTKHHEHAYLRLDACLPDKQCDSTYPRGQQQQASHGSSTIDDADFIYNDLGFFYPGRSPLYEIDMNQARGIQCRFGTPLLTAECHFDNERNYIAMLQGSRRYILSHPNNCPTLALYPQKHPLERHTRIDWRTVSSNLWQEHEEFANFTQSTVNEVVLLPGDVLYLPTYWFHHLVSLSDATNIQCNTRSGYSVEYDQAIYDCGFLYDFP